LRHPLVSLRSLAVENCIEVEGFDAGVG
jgi:hypothetical protein